MLAYTLFLGAHVGSPCWGSRSVCPSDLRPPSCLIAPFTTIDHLPLLPSSPPPQDGRAHSNAGPPSIEVETDMGQDVMGVMGQDVLRTFARQQRAAASVPDVSPSNATSPQVHVPPPGASTTSNVLTDDKVPSTNVSNWGADVEPRSVERHRAAKTKLVFSPSTSSATAAAWSDIVPSRHLPQCVFFSDDPFVGQATEAHVDCSDDGCVISCNALPLPAPFEGPAVDVPVLVTVNGTAILARSTLRYFKLCAGKCAGNSSVYATQFTVSKNAGRIHVVGTNLELLVDMQLSIGNLRLQPDSFDSQLGGFGGYTGT